MPVEEVLPQSVQDEMLALTSEIAHDVVRVAVPLTSYLMGVAVGRGASPEEALRIVERAASRARRVTQGHGNRCLPIVFPGHQV